MHDTLEAPVITDRTGSEMMRSRENRRGPLFHGHVLRVIEDFYVVELLVMHVVANAVPAARLRHRRFGAVVADDVGQREVSPEQGADGAGGRLVEQDALYEPLLLQQRKVEFHLFRATRSLQLGTRLDDLVGVLDDSAVDLFGHDGRQNVKTSLA